MDPTITVSGTPLPLAAATPHTTLLGWLRDQRLTGAPGFGCSMTEEYEYYRPTRDAAYALPCALADDAELATRPSQAPQVVGIRLEGDRTAYVRPGSLEGTLDLPAGSEEAVLVSVAAALPEALHGAPHHAASR